MTILEKQFIFSRLLADLLDYLHHHGYEVTMGECWRTAEMAELYRKSGKGISNSLHRIRLAVDLNLWKSGILLTKWDDYEEAGEYWESLSEPDYFCHWGGRFKKLVDGKLVHSPDAGHFSIGEGGIK